jgi:hypothetical protein
MESERKSPGAYVAELGSLVSASVAGNVELLNRASELVREALRTAPSRPPEPAALLGRWLDYQLTTYAAASTHGLALAHALLSATERALLGKTPAPASPAVEPRLDIRLEGRQGERVAAPFLIENGHDQSVEVAFETDLLVPLHGPSLPASLVIVEPVRLTVPPHSQAVAQIALDLSPAFIPGQTYETTVRILGLKAQQVRLTLSVLHPVAGQAASPQPPPEAPRPSQSSKPAGRRRAKPKGAR